MRKPNRVLLRLPALLETFIISNKRAASSQQPAESISVFVADTNTPAETTEQASPHGTEVVHNHHRQNHDVANNPGKSSDYVTWIATLRPENADVSIDQRFFIPGNPWGTVYEHTKSNIPQATATPVTEYDLGEVEQQEEHPPKPEFLYLCSPIDMIVGICTTALAILGVLVCEITAFCVYRVASIMYWTAKHFDPPNTVTGILYSCSMGVYYGFALGDSACLLASVLVPEVVVNSFWLCFVLSGGVWMAHRWHQYIRRTCHLIRWAFRSPFCEPPRNFSMCCFGVHGLEKAHSTPVEAEVVNEDEEAVVIPNAYAVED